MRPFIRRSAALRAAEIRACVEYGCDNAHDIARVLQCSPELVRYYIKRMTLQKSERAPSWPPSRIQYTQVAA